VTANRLNDAEHADALEREPSRFRGHLREDIDGRIDRWFPPQAQPA
jgi:hypothetical protein